MGAPRKLESDKQLIAEGKKYEAFDSPAGSINTAFFLAWPNGEEGEERSVGKDEASRVGFGPAEVLLAEDLE